MSYERRAEHAGSGDRQYRGLLRHDPAFPRAARRRAGSGGRGFAIGSSAPSWICRSRGVRSRRSARVLEPGGVLVAYLPTTSRCSSWCWRCPNMGSITSRRSRPCNVVARHLAQRATRSSDGGAHRLPSPWRAASPEAPRPLRRCRCVGSRKTQGQNYLGMGITRSARSSVCRGRDRARRSEESR